MKDPVRDGGDRLGKLSRLARGAGATIDSKWINTSVDRASGRVETKKTFVSLRIVRNR